MSVKQSTRYRVQIPAWFDGRGSDAPIVISTRIRVARNLARHRFLPHVLPQERTVIYNKIAESLRNQSQFGSFTIVNFSAISLLEQQLLVEKGIASPDLLRCEGNRGVAYDHSCRVNIMINEEDHLRFHYLDSGCRPSEMWGLVNAIDDRLGQNLDFAYDQRKGFLTSRPANSGSGLRVSFLMHLPGLALTKSVDTVLQGASQMGIAAEGFFCGHSGVVGNFFLLSSNATIGTHEGEFIESTHRIVAEVTRCEREARQRLLDEARLELTDRIYRAYGILRYARTLSVVEYLNLASALRLGGDLRLFTDIAIPDMNHATLLVMPAHLQHCAKKAMNEAECGVARAEFVRKLCMKKRKNDYNNSTTKNATMTRRN